MIRHLDRVIPSLPGKPTRPGAREFQKTARRIATEADAWTPDTARFVENLFDQMAPAWNSEHATNRFDALTDALQRGNVARDGTCLEIGSGTGQHTELLTHNFDHVIALDISALMLANAPAGVGTRVRADAAALPIATASLAAAVCVDVFLYPAELNRVLRADGALLWINQLASDGPLYVDTPTVIDALGGGWDALESEAGWGSWSVLHRR